jgi:hypothetical protein
MFRNAHKGLYYRDMPDPGYDLECKMVSVTAGPLLNPLPDLHNRCAPAPVRIYCPPSLPVQMLALYFLCFFGHKDECIGYSKNCRTHPQTAATASRELFYMNRRDPFCTAEAHPQIQDRSGSAQSPSCNGASVKSTLLFRGVLMRRRCDSCGTRIGIKCEGENKVILKCPECHREYTFFNHPDS